MLETIDHEIIMTWPSTLAVLAMCALGMFGLVTGWTLAKSDSVVGKIFGGAITTLGLFPLILGSLGLFLLSLQMVAADAVFNLPTLYFS